MPSIRIAFPAILIALCLIACSRDNNPPNNPTPPVNPTDTSHWKKIQAIDEGQAITDIWFIDSLHGIFCTDKGKIYITEDGGLTSKLTLGFQLTTDAVYSVFFLDKMRGYIISENHFCYTLDGGKTWILKKSPTYFSGIPSYSYSYSYLNLQFVSPSTGYITGGPQELLMTTDTGNTWQKVTGIITDGVYFSSPNTGWTYAYGDSILYTRDGGLNWKSISHLNEEYPSQHSSGYNILQFIDAQTGWLSQNKVVSTTSDGGKTWRVQTRAPQTDSTLFNDFQMLDGKTGFIATMQEFLKTNDGGNSWESDYKIPSNEFKAGWNIISIYAVDAHHKWACCTKGIILKYIP